MISSHHHLYSPPRQPAAPTLLLLHGTGGSEHDLLPIGRRVAPQAGLLSPRGNVLERGMPRFFRRLAEGVFDLDDLRVRAAELAAFVSSAAEHYQFDRQNVVAVGYSNGANMAAALLLLQPGILSAAVLFHAMVPLVPVDLPQLARTRVLLTAGLRDPLVPAANSRQLADLLRACGADVTLHWQPDGHQLHPDEIALAGTWLAQSDQPSPA